jgi:hypothetical protein
MDRSSPSVQGPCRQNRLIDWSNVGAFVGGLGGVTAAFFGHRNNRQLRTNGKHPRNPEATAQATDATIRENLEALVAFASYQHNRNHDVLGSIAANYIVTWAIAVKLGVDMPPLQVIIDGLKSRLYRPEGEQ